MSVVRSAISIFLVVTGLYLTCEARISREALKLVDETIIEGINAKQAPGAVLLVAEGDQVVHHKAFGNRAVLPLVENMTLDTIFDLASLTKPFATGLSIMHLVQEGKLSLQDTLGHLFGVVNDKEHITVQDLLLHTSGLAPDSPVSDFGNGLDNAVQCILKEPLNTPPKTAFKYSDLGYILLGAIVEQASGLPEDIYVRKNIYSILNLNDTCYLPPAEKVGRIAPTVLRDGKWLRGQVEDPRSSALGGVSGHAGLFSTASDLFQIVKNVIFSEKNRKILGKLTLEKMTTPITLPGDFGTRCLGWDVDTAFSSNRGDIFSSNGFGHTGFSGTSVWVDLESRTTIILLTNAIHPDGVSEKVISLRRQVASIVAGGII